MTFIKKYAMHAKRRTESLNIINTISNGTSMLFEYIQQSFQLRLIQFRTDNNKELVIRPKELIPRMGGRGFNSTFGVLFSCSLGASSSTLRTSLGDYLRV